MTKGPTWRMADGDRFGEQPLPRPSPPRGDAAPRPACCCRSSITIPTVDAMLAQIADWEKDLAAAVAARPDAADRRGRRDTQRVYLDHAFDIGAFNPCFPEYAFDHIDAETAAGRVTFPVAYEGPPGLVHGGFLAVFFDCVIQHQNCATALSGKTRSLTVKFRRPTPSSPNCASTSSGRRSTGRSRRRRGCCSTTRCCASARSTRWRLPPDKLTGFQFGKRRDKNR